MEKMIKVINDNLKSVISGIKTHKKETEDSLASVKKEMDDKIAVANEYRASVNDAKAIISKLEDEISQLQDDLSELNQKFGDKDFGEILKAGNKEINGKIRDKKILINKQSQRILKLTDSAHILKDELVSLKEKRISIETTLEKDTILEQYYENRINSIIEYSEEHPEELKNFLEVPQEELLSNADVYENEDIKKIIDGSIFDEIDDIGNNVDIYDEDILAEPSFDDDEEDETIEDKLSMTQQLDDIILQANDIIAKKQDIADEDITDDDIEFNEEIKEDDDSIDIFVNDDLETNVIPEENIVTPSLITPDKIEEKSFDHEYDDYKEEDFDDLIDEEKMFSALDSINGSSPIIDHNGSEEELLEEEKEEVEPEEENLIDLNMESEELPEINVEEDLTGSNYPIIDDTKAVDPNEFLTTSSSRDEISESGLDSSKFTDVDLDRLKENFDKAKTMEFISTMANHNLDISLIYDNVDILIDVDADKLNKILNELEKTGVDSKTISYVFGSFNKINVDELENAVKNNIDGELSEILYKVIPYNDEVNLVKDLELTTKEDAELKKNTTEDEYKIMNLFSNIVLTNYNELNKYNVNNIRECLTKHPHRFMMNPDKFAAILDKYDPEDLTRCVNKNAAVIDKL